jgi:glycosyltransferase involved in cell wall biosynthesis
MVTKFVPLPADSGGKRRSLALLERLAVRGPTVLCAFDDGRGDLAGLRARGVDVRTATWATSKSSLLRGTARTRSVSAARFWSPELQAAVRRAASEAPVDVLQVEYAQLARYAEGLDASIKTLDLHNVESSLFGSYARLQGGARRLLTNAEARLLKRIEGAATQTFDVVTVVSETDRRRLPAGKARVLVCPNGWEYAEMPAPSDEHVVVFVALLGWAPNADAAIWFTREAWPRVVESVPEARLLLVGRDPGRELQELGGPTVEVTGPVPEVGPYLARASVAIAPLRAGGGSRLKILEALGAGRPVVSTSLGAEGLEDLAGAGLVVADGAPAMVEAIVGLLRDPARRRSLGRHGHEAVRERYTWDATLRPLLDLYDGRNG